MGIHTGTGTLGGDDYVGIDVHRAARIADTAHGGQTVLSEPTAVLAERAIADDLTLRDLGKHRLKDLAEPETMFELIVGGLEEEFPILRTLDAIPNNLPMLVTSFVGRERDLAEALRLLERTRVLTLTGPGGTGKTRLALQIGAELGAAFRHGVFFVDLAPVSDAEVVPSRILDSLGLQAPAGSGSVTDAVRHHLATLEVLLLLDNFEHVIASAPLVADLVRASPRSRFVVTSRGPLRISGEQELPVQPLPVPGQTEGDALLDVDSVQLFIERAMAVRPDFELTPENAAAVAELVRRLDGLPLAIELIASQVRLLPVATIVDRLDAGMLGSGAVDLPERQRTIEGAIAWSHSLLDEPHRRLFARLSVFAPGGRIEEIEQVCGAADGVDVIGGLGVLLDQSLLFPVTAGGQPRIRMLRVIREYAAARLGESGEEDEIRRRHVRVYTELVEAAAPRLRGRDRKRWLDTLEADHDNLRAALDWATAGGETDLALRLTAAAWRFWQTRGHLHEAERRVGAALAMPGGDPSLRAKALEALGGVLWWQGRTAECRRVYEEALGMQRRLGDPREIANALYNAALAMVFDRPDEGRDQAAGEATAALDEAEDIYRTLGDIDGLGDVAWGRGNIMSARETDRPAAVPHFMQSLDYYRRSGNEFGLGWSYYEVGFLSLKAGDHEAAWRHFRNGLALFADHRDVSAAVLFLAGIAGLALEEGDRERAVRLAGAFHGLRITSGTDLVSHDLAQVQGLEFETLEELTGDLGAAYRAGSSMDFDQAVAYALAGPTDHSDPAG